MYLDLYQDKPAASFSDAGSLKHFKNGGTTSSSPRLHKEHNPFKRENFISFYLLCYSYNPHSEEWYAIEWDTHCL
jgi:hypothetical protein